MAVEIGYGLLVIGLVNSMYGAVAALYGRAHKGEDWIQSARISALIGFPLLTASVILLEVLIFTGRYDVAYVYEVGSHSLPGYLKIAALWGGQFGSLLFWCWLMALMLFVYTLRHRHTDDRLPWMIAIPQFTIAFFLVIIIFVSNPFNRMFIDVNGNQILSVLQPANTLAILPQDGAGLNPLLRHPGMVLHPPVLYLGFVGFVIPFSAAVADLAEKKFDSGWVKDMRIWILVSWLFLFAGLLLGSRWAYDLLAWGGYWGWDAVEIAALMPWLSASALLHSMSQQESGTGGKRWNAILIMLTFLLVILGTFITRSGWIASVHSFTTSRLGYFLLGFILLCLTGCVVLLVVRWKGLKPGGKHAGWLSKQTALQATNLLFAGILAVCLWGLIYPALVQGIAGKSVSIEPEYYRAASGPLFAALVLLIGICPLLARSRSSLRDLGKLAWMPATAAVLIAVIALVSGLRNWMALLALAILTFSLAALLGDCLRAVWIKHKSSSENLLKCFWSLTVKNSRRSGGILIHFGVLLLATGIIGIEFSQTYIEKNIRKNESIEVAGYGIRNDGVEVINSQEGKTITLAKLVILKNDRITGKLEPQIDYYSTWDQFVSIPAIYSNIKEDLYIVLAGTDTGQTATFKIYHNPLINWLWIGGIVLMLGTVVAMLPQPDPVRKKSMVDS